MALRDASMPLVKPPVEARCASAKFQACSPSCDAIVVTNNSDAPVDVNLKFNGPGFSEEDESGFNFLGECDGPTGERRSYSKPDSCNHLLSGKNCIVRINFCPDRSGTSRGRLKVVTTASGKPQATTFDLIADALYSPELQAADEARRRHLGELKKIPHVADVVIDPKDHDIFIDVEVDEDGSLDKVRRAVSPKIEGYEVEVTRYIERSVGL